MAAPVVTLMDGYPQAEGAKWGAVANVTGPSSYATGGFTLSAVSFGMSQIDYASASASVGGVRNYIVKPIANGNKPSATITVIAIVIATGVEVAAAVDLSASNFRIRVIGV